MNSHPFGYPHINHPSANEELYFRHQQALAIKANRDSIARSNLRDAIGNDLADQLIDTYGEPLLNEVTNQRRLLVPKDASASEIAPPIDMASLMMNSHDTAVADAAQSKRLAAQKECLREVENIATRRAAIAAANLMHDLGADMAQELIQKYGEPLVVAVAAQRSTRVPVDAGVPEIAPALDINQLPMSLEDRQRAGIQQREFAHAAAEQAQAHGEHAFPSEGKPTNHVASVIPAANRAAEPLATGKTI